MLSMNDFPPMWLYSIGLSILPGKVSAVVLDKVYRVQKMVTMTLPEGVIDKAGTVLKSAQLQQAIEVELKPQLVQYLSQAVGYVTLMPPVCQTVSLPKQLPPNEAFESLQMQLHDGELFDDKTPFVQDARLWEGDAMMGVAACAMPKMLLRQYDNALSCLNMPIHKIEVLPLSLARVMAASGVVDSMLMTHGQTMPWGLIAKVGQQLVMMFWQGPHVMHLEQIAIEGLSQEALNQRVLMVAETVACEYPAKWFSWPEDFASIDWNLKTPVVQLEIGPFYTQQPQVKLDELINVAPALGVALCKQLLLPVEWDFVQYAQPAMLPMDQY